MSVNSAMTAIARKIRSLLGISGTMGLDAMATNLGTEQTNIANAFSAIGNKGGTVPNSKVSGNLVSAINSIPLGVTVQRATGEITAAGQTINCGFKPDLVVMFVTEPNVDGDYYHLVFGFTALSAETVVQCSEAAEYFMYVQATRTSNGFILDWTNKFSFDWEYIGSTAQSFRYVAVKYT